MSEEMTPHTDPTPQPPDLTPATERQKAYNLFANKCFELGQALYLKNQYEEGFEQKKSALLYDIDKLAKKHDSKLAKEKENANDTK